MRAVRLRTGYPAEEIEVGDSWHSIAPAIEAELIEVVRPTGFGPRDLSTGYPVLVVDEEGALRPGRTLNAGASLIYGGAIYGQALVIGEGMVDSGEGYEEPDLVGLEDIPSRSQDGWVGYVNHLVRAIALAQGNGG